MPKKKKKKGRYVEPGSTRGLFSVILLGLIGFGCFKYQPWKDDWEMVRALFGKGRHHSLVGDWVVTKAISISRKPGVVARDNVHTGQVKFNSKGNVTLALVHSESETTATGQYKQDGIKVAMQDLRTTGDSSVEVPRALDMNLAWQGNDDVTMLDKNEAIWLHRQKKKASPVAFMQLILRKGEKPDEGQAPAEIRGAIGDIKRSMQDNEDFANNN